MCSGFSVGLVLVQGSGYRVIDTFVSIDDAVHILHRPVSWNGVAKAGIYFFFVESHVAMFDSIKATHGSSTKSFDCFVCIHGSGFSVGLVRG